MNRYVHSLVWGGLGVLAGVLFFGLRPTAHAYPEYTGRTGQQCSTCHVNPAGGGPRTLRGLLWIAQGRPDAVPPLPGSDKPAESGGPDGPALYEKYECARCHGITGEGDVGPAFTGTEWPSDKLIDVIVNGTGTMKGFGQGTLSDAEMEALVAYVQAIGRGEIQSSVVLQKRLLPPARLTCSGVLTGSTPRQDCGGN